MACFFNKKMMMVLSVVNNLILIAIVLPNETIIYVVVFKSLYRPTFTLEGVDMKVISFQMTPTMFVAMWRRVIKGEVKKKAKRDQIIQTNSRVVPFASINQQATKVPLPFNITTINKRVQPNKHVHSPFKSTIGGIFSPTWR
jgi:hypothetical protein